MNSEIGQFCVLAKAQRGLACAHLIVKVIGHKNIFSFGELLDIPSIAAVRAFADISERFYLFQENALIVSRVS